ncbi:amino acid:proton antiporter, partial [Limosilactobacillus reuteri]
LIVVSVLLTILPTGKNDFDAKMPVLIGTIATLIIGEITVRVAQRGKNSNPKERNVNYENLKK